MSTTLPAATTAASITSQMNDPLGILLFALLCALVLMCIVCVLFVGVPKYTWCYVSVSVCCLRVCYCCKWRKPHAVARGIELKEIIHRMDSGDETAGEDEMADGDDDDDDDGGA